MFGPAAHFNLHPILPIILILQSSFRSAAHLNTLPQKWFWGRVTESLWTGGPWALSSMNFWLDACHSLGTLQKSYLDKSSVVNIIRSYFEAPVGKQLLNVILWSIAELTTKMLTFVKQFSQQIKRTHSSSQITGFHNIKREIWVENGSEEVLLTWNLEMYWQCNWCLWCAFSAKEIGVGLANEPIAVRSSFPL